MALGPRYPYGQQLCLDSRSEAHILISSDKVDKFEGLNTQQYSQQRSSTLNSRQSYDRSESSLKRRKLRSSQVQKSQAKIQLNLKTKKCLREKLERNLKQWKGWQLRSEQIQSLTQPKLQRDEKKQKEKPVLSLTEQRLLESLRSLKRPASKKAAKYQDTGIYSKMSHTSSTPWLAIKSKKVFDLKNPQSRNQNMVYERTQSPYYNSSA